MTEEDRNIVRLNAAEKQRAEKACQAIQEFLNVMGHDQNVMINALATMHRTLQQNFTGLCLRWLLHLSKLPEGHYDLRNEASVEMARRLMVGMDEYDIHLPFI